MRDKLGRFIKGNIFGFQKGNKINLGKKYSKERKQKIGLAHKGKRETEETRRKLSKIRKGKPSNKKGKKYPQFSGKSHWNWQGGKTEIAFKIRNSIEYKLWREAVYVKDYWTCQKCGKKGDKIDAHHLKSFSLFPELRFAIDNGITLCRKCHIQEEKLSV